MYSLLCEPVEWLGPLFILRLNSGGTAMLFSMVAAPFYVPVGSAGGFQFLRTLVNTRYCLLQ